jgi:hypothetical protein
MLNQVHVAGMVTKQWTYGGSRFVRVACHPDPGRTLKRSAQEGTVEPDRITLRFEPPLATAAQTLKPGAVVRASGYLSSREYAISLAEFAEAAQTGAGGKEARRAAGALRQLVDQVGDVLAKPAALNEVVVEHFTEEETGSAGRQRRRR